MKEINVISSSFVKDLQSLSLYSLMRNIQCVSVGQNGSVMFLIASLIWPKVSFDANHRFPVLNHLISFEVTSKILTVNVQCALLVSQEN